MAPFLNFPTVNEVTNRQEASRMPRCMTPIHSATSATALQPFSHGTKSSAVRKRSSMHRNLFDHPVRDREWETEPRGCVPPAVTAEGMLRAKITCGTLPASQRLFRVKTANSLQRR
jgi:hypothetical protein